MDAGHAEAAKADDAGAQQGRNDRGFGIRRKGNGEVGANGSEFGIASVTAVARENRPIAEVLHLVAAEPAIAVDAAHPRNAGSDSDRQVRCVTCDNFADDLVAGDQLRLEGRKVAFDDVKIGATDTAGQDLEQDLAGSWRGDCGLRNREPLAGNASSGIKNRGSHSPVSHSSGSAPRTWATKCGCTGRRKSLRSL